MARLARMEMDTLKEGAPWMTDDEAWAEARGLFLVRPDWVYEKMADAKEAAKEAMRLQLESNREPARRRKGTGESSEL